MDQHGKIGTSAAPTKSEKHDSKSLYEAKVDFLISKYYHHEWIDYATAEGLIKPAPKVGSEPEAERSTAPA